MGGVTIKSLIKKRYDMVKVESKWIKNKRNIGYIGDKIYLPDTFLSASFYFQGNGVKVSIILYETIMFIFNDFLNETNVNIFYNRPNTERDDIQTKLTKWLRWFQWPGA